MSGSVVYTLHLWPPLGHAAHYTGSTPEARLGRRLTDHAVGRGARLTQVQLERGGSWVLAQTQPGGRMLERRLKQHGAARRCEVCKAVGAYQAGDLTAPEALARAGWQRANLAERPLLLQMFGLEAPPAGLAATPPGPAPPLPEPPQLAPWPPPQPISPAEAAEIDGLVEELIAGWRSPKAGAPPLPEPELEAGL